MCVVSGCFDTASLQQPAGMHVYQRLSLIMPSLAVLCCTLDQKRLRACIPNDTLRVIADVATEGEARHTARGRSTIERDRVPTGSWHSYLVVPVKQPPHPPLCISLCCCSRTHQSHSCIRHRHPPRHPRCSSILTMHYMMSCGCRGCHANAKCCNCGEPEMTNVV
jgi:hypothetical protein